MDRRVLEQDIHWIVGKLVQNPELTINKNRIFGAMGLPQFQLQDLTTRLLVFGLGSDAFLSDILLKWITARGSKATFKALVQILREESFISSADEILEEVEKIEIAELDLRLSVADISDIDISHTDISIRELPNIRQIPLRRPTLKHHLRSIFFEVPERFKFFTGRLKELTDLHESIKMSANSPKPTVLLPTTNSFGFGKTTLTVEYAWTYFANFFSHVIWINAEAERRLKESFSRLARTLQINVDDCQLDKLALDRISSLIYAYMNLQDGKTLIIFNNVDNQIKVQRYLPLKTGKLFFLLTSLEIRNWKSADVRLIILNPFTETESIDFMSNFVSLKAPAEKSYAKEICYRLRNLPLAVSLCGTYLKEMISIPNIILEKEMKKYLDAWDSHERNTMYLNIESPSDRIAFVTLNVTLDKVKKENKLTIDVLTFISYFNSDNIPIDFELPNGTSVGLNVVKLLERFAIVTHRYDELSGAPSLFVHNLVQKVMRVRTESKFGLSKLGEVALWMESALVKQRKFNFNEFNVKYFHLLNHAQCIVRHLKSKFDKESKSSKFNLEKVLNTSQSELIDISMTKLGSVFEVDGFERTTELFFQLDSSGLLYKFGLENKLIYIGKYYRKFLLIAIGEILFQSKIQFPSQRHIFEKLEHEMRLIFKKNMIEFSLIPDPLSRFFSSVLSLTVGGITLPNVRFELMSILLKVFETMSKYRRENNISVFIESQSAINLISGWKEIGNIDGIWRFLRDIDAMLRDMIPENEYLLESKLADFLLEFQLSLPLAFEGNPIIFTVSLRIYSMLFEACLKGVNFYHIFTIALGMFKCFVGQGHFERVVEFLAKFNNELAGGHGRHWNENSHIDGLWELANYLFEIAVSPDGLRIKTRLLDEILVLYRQSGFESFLSTPILIGILKCLVASGKLDEFRTIVEESRISIFKCLEINHHIDKVEPFESNDFGAVYLPAGDDTTFSILQEKLCKSSLTIEDLIKY